MKFQYFGILIIISICLLIGCATAMSPWTEVSGGWSDRSGLSSVVLPDHSIVIMGGQHLFGTKYLNDVWRSTDNGVTWSEQTPLLQLDPDGNREMGGAEWSPRYGQQSVVLSDGSIVLIGGFDDNGYSRQNVNDVWRSTDQGMTWNEMTPPIEYDESGNIIGGGAEWGPRGGFTTIVLSNDTIVLMGGGGSFDVFNDTWISIDKGATWTEQTAHAEWSGRSWSSSVTIGTDIILLGGFSGNPVESSEVWKSTNLGRNWTLLNSIPGWVGRWKANSVVLQDDSILLMGGQDDSYNFLNDTWKSTDNGSTWVQQIVDSGWIGRDKFTSNVLSDDSVIIMGGNIYYEDVGFTNDVWRSTNNGVTWNQINSLYRWSVRSNSGVLSLSDGSIVVMGGSTYAGDNGGANDTWRSTDGGSHWTLMNASSGWSPRWNFASVVQPDDSIVIIGGGSADFTFNDVWRSTDKGATWIDMNESIFSDGSIVGMPAVSLSDNSIVLMGANHEGIDYNETWRSTDNGATWELINASSGWEPRNSFSSVALPDGSIVLMGGQLNNSGLANDVWRSTDKGVTWTEITPHMVTDEYGYISGGAEWGPRMNFATTVSNGDIILTGGYADFGLQNDVWVSTDSGATWTNMNINVGWNQRQGHGLVSLPNQTIALLGGQWYYGEAGQLYMNDIWLLSLSYLPPFANFTATSPSGYYIGNVLHGYMPFTVNFNDTSVGGTPTAWSWSFGDGTYSTQQNTTHTYPINNTYFITLIATNSAGSSNYTRRVTVDPIIPIADFTVSPNVGNIPLTVSFTDASLGVSIINWSWDFGDNTTGSYLRNPVHTYTRNGTYYIRLSVITLTGNYNVSQPIPIYAVTNPVPMADFTASPLSGKSPLVVQFTDKSTALNGLVGWNWSFGDGNYTNSTSQNPLHVYQSPGQYSITLVVLSSDDHTNYTVRHGYINVEVPTGSANADYTATPTSGNYPLTIQFYDTSVCNPVCNHWAWDFTGDGTVESVVQNPIYTYTYPGNYSPKLVVTNGVNAGTKIYNSYISVGPIFVQPTIPQPTTTWIPRYNYNGSMYSYTGATTVDVVNSTYLKYWLQNYTTSQNFSVYAFAIGTMAPLMHVFGFWIYLMIWGLYLFAVWIRSQDVTLPLIIGIISMGTFGLLFPKESLPVIIVMFVVCGAIIITKLMKDSL